MKLSLKNISKVDNAEVEINGITIIAGENNTGKSTVGKVLFSIFNSFYKIDEQIYNERKDSIEEIILKDISMNSNRVRVRHLLSGSVRKLIEKKEANQSNLKNELIIILEDYFKEINEEFDNGTIENLSSKVIEILAVPDDLILKTVLSKNISAEFNGQINNIYNDKEGEIKLTIRGNTMSVNIKNNEVYSISNRFSLNTEAIYLDDPFVLDEEGRMFYFGSRTYLNHREHLKTKLFASNIKKSVISEILAVKKLENIYSKINNICSGEIVKGKSRGVGYKVSDSEEVLDIKNLSTGLKTFAILKTLLTNGSLEENGTIILDEPEIHLHPEWQLILAELIVLIQKEFGMHILINTHSPYFLNAIEVYASKYEIADKCNYYITESKGDVSNIIDVTDNIDEIYKKLARPLQELENERYRK